MYVEQALLGDPCPGNYKYLQVNYTCSGEISRQLLIFPKHVFKIVCLSLFLFVLETDTLYFVSVCRNDNGNDADCDKWADSWSECDNNPNWMMAYCRKSCTHCDWKST